MPQAKNQGSDPQPEEEQSLAERIVGRMIYENTPSPRKILCVNQLCGSSTKYTIVTDKGPSIPVSDLRTFVKEHGMEV